MFLPEAFSSEYCKIYAGVCAQTDHPEMPKATACAQELFEAVKAGVDARTIMGITEHLLLPQTGSSDKVTAAAFDVDVPVDDVGKVRQTAADMAEADPDICICILPVFMENPDDKGEDIASHADRERVSQIRGHYIDLIRFGQKMKREGVTEEDTLTVEETFSDIIVYGDRDKAEAAYAAIGLRLGGDDGQFVGTYDMTGFSSRKYGSVALCIGGFRGTYAIDPKFADRTGSKLGFHEHIVLIDNAKAVLDNGEFTLLCTLGNDDMWRPYGPDDFNKRRKHDSCDFFELDDDCIDRFKETKKRACSCCLFRKLTEDGFVCTAGHVPVR